MKKGEDRFDLPRTIWFRMTFDLFADYSMITTHEYWTHRKAAYRCGHRDWSYRIIHLIHLNLSFSKWFIALLKR